MNNNNINIEDVIYEDSFLKNIKRMFIMKQMENHNIKKFTIEYDENTKSFKMYLINDDANIYYIDYKIKRRKKKQIYNNNVKKRRLENNKLIMIENENVYDNSSGYNIANNMNPPPCHIPKNIDTNTISNVENIKNIKNNINTINSDGNKNVNDNNKTYNDNLDKTLKNNYRKNNLCIKLYKYLRLFIKIHNINNCDDNIYVKTILREIEKVFYNYGFDRKKLHEMDNL